MPPLNKRIQPAVLVVRKSTLPGVGKGLFTKDFIVKGQLIVEYKGTITTLKQVQENNEVNPYVFLVNRSHVIDAKAFPENVARYANDAEGITTYPGCVNNARFVIINKRVFLKAECDILPGAEILVPYGKDYWDTIRFNKAVEKSYGQTHRKIKKT